MKHILLTVLTLMVLFFACSKSNNAPAPPPSGGTDTTHQHDTTPAPGGSHDTTPKPPAETPGVTKVGGTLDWVIDFAKPYDMAGSGFKSYVRVMDFDTAHCSVELINAYKGTCTIKYHALNGDTTIAFVFSPEDYWTSLAECNNPDTAGIVQIHIYRKDGKNIKTGVKDIYMPLGTAPADIVGQGEIAINNYPGIYRKLTLDSLVSIIASRSKLTLLNSDGF